jgi:hypothetical protein
LLNFKRSSLDLGLPLGVSGYFAFPVRSSLALRRLSEEEDQDNPEQIIKLPPYQNVNTSLGVTIRARRSLRQFTQALMKEEEQQSNLDAFCREAVGIVSSVPLQQAVYGGRSAPKMGGGGRNGTWLRPAPARYRPMQLIWALTRCLQGARMPPAHRWSSL